MKHGPIALVDDGVPIIVLAPSGGLFDKTISNMHEVIARKGQVFLLSDDQGLQDAGPVPHSIALPAVETLLRRYYTPCRCSCWPITWRC